MTGKKLELKKIMSFLNMRGKRGISCILARVSSLNKGNTRFVKNAWFME